MDKTKHYYESVYGYGFNVVEYDHEEVPQEGKLLSSHVKPRRESRSKQKRREKRKHLQRNRSGR